MKIKKPVIGILPTYNLTNEDNDPYLDRANFVNLYSDKIVAAGGIPIGLTDKNIEMYTSICDGYVWPGGGKIFREFNIALEDAIKFQKPFLGICLGAQAIATFFNILEDQEKTPQLSLEEVYQQNKSENPYLVRLEDSSLHDHYVTKEEESIERAKHPIQILKNSFLYEIYKEESIRVPSMHTMIIPRTPHHLLVSAYSSDNVVEAVEYHENNNKILGVQYHPEILEDLRIFEWLIENTFLKYRMLVDKEHPITDSSFTIVEYSSTYPTNNSNLELNTYQAWIALQDYVRSHGYFIDIESAYRSKESQQQVMEEIIEKYGVEYASIYVAKPGYSEHQTGLAIDICMKKDGKWFTDFDEELQDCYTLLKKVCSSFGFILRYPENKEDITGYPYEPWHFRFVGNSLVAKKIMENDWTLEEYLESSSVLCQKLQK